jgi:carboxypeptidase D
MVWVEQPVGTGFSQGKPEAKNDFDVAAEFLGFFKNFIDTFGLQHKKIYVTGESYAGYYVPYIADAMLNKKDKVYYDLQAIMIYDPSTSTDYIQEQVPAVAFMDYWKPIFSLNDSYVDTLHKKAKTCGYTDYLNKYLVFPPAGVQPIVPPETAPGDCDVFTDLFNAATLINPCFDIYQIATTCPLLWDVLGFPGSIGYLPVGASIYFDREDVKKAIHAPNITWEECSSIDVYVGKNGQDESPPSGLTILPSVIERTNGRSIISHGALDMVLIANGTLLMIQNMTWGGKLGFQQKPASEFFVPYHDDYNNDATLAGAGVFGTTHTERGLTWVDVSLSGHMTPQYAPSASFRQMEFLLGRIDKLTQ